MPTGASPRREREFKKIARKMKKEGQYKGREEEVAARIVNKQRAEKGETKEAHRHKPPRRSASRRKTRTSRTTRAAPKRK